MLADKPLPHTICPLCKGPNACAPACSGSFDTPCWCRQVKVSPWARQQVAHLGGTSCLCERCARLGVGGGPGGTDEAAPAPAAP